MDKTTKHRVNKLLNFFDFSGGLNYTLPTDLMADNECPVMDNVMFDPTSGLVTSRPVFAKVGNLKNFQGAYFANDVAYLIDSGLLFRIKTEGENRLEKLSDTLIPCPSTPKFTPWDNGFIITTGGEKVFYFKDGELKDCTPLTPDKTPIAPTGAFIRLGRVVLYRETFDALYYSAVGELVWTYGELESDAKYVEVGYKDSGDIAAVIPLSRDIIIFKTNGIIYRLINEFPDWVVAEIARNVFTVKNSALQLLNSAVFLTHDGLMSLDTVQSYGDIQVNKNMSRKIDPVLIRQIYNEGEIYNFPSIQSLFINSNPSGINFLMSLTNAAFTRWALPFTVKSGGECGGKIYFIAPDALYESSNSNEEGGELLTSRIKTKTYLNRNKWLLKATDIYIKPNEKGKISVCVGMFQYDVEALRQFDAFSNTIIARINNTPLVNSVWQKQHFNDVYSTDRLEVDIKIEGRGSVRIETLAATIGD